MKTNARNITTDYGYNTAGQVETIDYSDATPDVSFSYRRSGDVHVATHNDSTYTYDYGLPGEKEQCTVSGGILNGAIIDPEYDALHRRDTLTVNPGNGIQSVTQSWNYQAGSSRLDSVSQGVHAATYSYDPNSSLIKTISFANNGANRLTETRVYDHLNRLRSVAHFSSAAANAVSKSFTYTYNDANQRTRIDREDSTYWSYGYDTLGHVETASRQLADGTPLAGHQFGYNFDALGNRETATFGGDETGIAGFQTISYTPKTTGDRNQYESITSPGVVLTTGTANTNAAVTINGQPAETRQNEFFAHQQAVANETSAEVLELIVEANDGTNTNSLNRKELVAKKSTSQTYDDDGNLTFDGYRDFTWDAENRLLSVQTRTDLVPEGAEDYRVEYDYDYLSRRIQRRAQQKIGNEWYTINQTRYLYDGWNVIAEITGDSASPQLDKSYLWGLDISGSAQGAGGVGGLLAIQKYVGNQVGAHYVSADGNGNVIALSNAQDGTQSASYEYDPFGNMLDNRGVFAELNRYRFSTKPQDEQSGLYYYGYRYYDPGNGRWLNRDPIEEYGGLNLYGFGPNAPMNGIDLLGGRWWKPTLTKPRPGALTRILAYPGLVFIAPKYLRNFFAGKGDRSVKIDNLWNEQQKLLADMISLCKKGDRCDSDKKKCDYQTCVFEAHRFASEIRNAVEFVGLANVSNYSGWSQNFMHSVHTVYLAGEGGNGYNPIVDTSCGIGLRCGGWNNLQELAIFNASLGLKSNCFTFKRMFWEVGIRKHEWLGIFGPENESDNPDIELDPWQTGGASIYQYKEVAPTRAPEAITPKDNTGGVPIPFR